MSIKLVPLTKAFPTSGYDTNKKRCFLFIDAGIDYLKACDVIDRTRNQVGPLFHVELPLMHMTLELLVKAHATKVDSTFNPKKPKYRHNTAKIIDDYADRVKIFRIIKSDEAKMALIKGLESSWNMVRYAEAYIQYEGKDWDIFKGVALELIEEYHKITGVPFLSHHIPSSGKSK